MNQQQRNAERGAKWRSLIALAEAGDVVQFYAEYAKYLEWDGITSTNRKALHKMALAVVLSYRRDSDDDP